jgi:hypothetical protein
VTAVSVFKVPQGGRAAAPTITETAATARGSRAPALQAKLSHSSDAEWEEF